MQGDQGRTLVSLQDSTQDAGKAGVSTRETVQERQAGVVELKRELVALVASQGAEKPGTVTGGTADPGAREVATGGVVPTGASQGAGSRVATGEVGLRAGVSKEAEVRRGGEGGLAGVPAGAVVATGEERLGGGVSKGAGVQGGGKGGLAGVPAGAVVATGEERLRGGVSKGAGVRGGGEEGLAGVPAGAVEVVL